MLGPIVIAMPAVTYKSIRKDFHHGGEEVIDAHNTNRSWRRVRQGLVRQLQL